MLVMVEKAIYQAKSLKQLFLKQNNISQPYLLSPNIDPCVTISSVTFYVDVVVGANIQM